MVMMEWFQLFILALLSGFALMHLIHAQDQSAFISIDCGLAANASYTEESTGIIYISDAAFIDSGISESIFSGFKDIQQPQLSSLRSFPQGIRNCYSINITKGTKYLIRATFLYGDYDGQNKLPQFDLYLGPNMWDSVKLKNVSLKRVKELIHMPTRNYIQVCLVNTGSGTPFISAIELRPLPNTTYVTEYGSLALRTRIDFGSISNHSYRYPDDVFDRIWLPDNFHLWETNTSLTVDFEGNNHYQVPSVVMQTASTPINGSNPLKFYWDQVDASEYYFYMHFAEVVKLEANQSRSFNITLNGEYWYGPLVPYYLYKDTVHNVSASTGGGYHFSIIKTESSTLPPIINAIEAYSVKNLSQSETYQQDVAAITNIKSTYGIKRNWQGDPCVPQEYFWDGLNCTYHGYNPPSIIYLNLSSSGLTGKISVDISNLVMLQYLDLSNNSLTGSVPDFLSQLQYLRVLNLERNQLTGSVPAKLIDRSNNGSLTLSVRENSNLCASDSCKKKNNIVVPIVTSVGGLFILSLIVAAIMCQLRKRKQDDKTKGTESKSFESIQRQFKYSDLIKITNNFTRILGKGGFGEVYHGYIDDTQVAVKILSQSSVQGYQQFEAEVKLLMRVHHKSLTSLVGYCYEGTYMGLIYEYMANGDLETHLSGENKNILSWEARLQITIDAAQGLEYLHHGCKPPIIHRDVKTTNILLSENLHAKLADFGLSKVFPADGGTHVSTVNIGGTPGYQDPEYSTSYRLTEKSDVYSFGVVLLRIITCRPVIERSHENIHITQWVRFMLAKGDIKNILDPRLQGAFNSSSVSKVIEIAMLCVSPDSTKRPTMSKVVTELKECLASEIPQREGSEGESSYSIEMIDKNLPNDVNPLAR